MNQSQLESWEIVKKTLNRRQKKILNFFKENEFNTSYSIAYDCNIPIHEVTPRISELKDKGIIINSGRTIVWNKKTYTLWRRARTMIPPEKTVVLRVTENELKALKYGLAEQLVYDYDGLYNKIKKAQAKFGGGK